MSTDTRTIVVVGVGALGSHFVQFARNLAPLHVIDFDVVEAKNLLSQFHGKPGARRNKTQALRGVMDLLWGVKVGTTPHKLVRDNVDQLLRGANLVVDCLDNFEARRLVQEYVRQHEIPCLHGGVSGDGKFGMIVWDELFTPDESAPGATCEDGQHLPFLAFLSSVMAGAVQRFLSKGEKVSLWATPMGLRTL